MRKVQQLLGVGSVFALAAGGAFAGLTASSVAGAEPTTFDTAGVSSFAVPAGVCSVTIMASGAAGGGVGLLATGINNDGTPSDNVNAAAANAGGVGAAVTATVTVTPGETLAVQVGGAGGSTGAGGVGGGGGGASNGGGGGGASVVSGSTGPLVVAGGGGGGGASVGGNAGTLGQAGTDGGGSGGGHGGSSAGVGGNGASDGGGFGGGAGGGVNGGGTGDGGGAGGTGAAGVGGGGGGGGNTATPGGAGGTGGTGTGSGGTGTLGGAQGGLGNSTGGDGGGGSSAIQSGGGGGGGIGFGGGGGGMGGAGDGGGGAGYGGGGGGGASGPAGGGGGGTSFVAPGAVGTSSALSELTDGQVTITPGAPGIGCPSTLQVQKLVSGPSTTGFTEHVACTAPAIDSAVTTTVASVDLPVNADGTPDGTSPPAGWSVVDGKWQSQDAALVGATCTLTETATGGATSVSYACAWTAGSSDHLSSVGCPGAASGPSATAPSVTFEGNGDVGVLTVTNTFPAAPIPAAAIVAAPHFTG